MIRPAVEADLDDVLKLAQACFGPHAWTRSMFRAELDRAAAGSGSFFLTPGEGGLDGLAIGWAEAETSEVLLIAVDPGRRQEGLGRALLGALLEAARMRAATESWLEVRADNMAALRLYEGAGYSLSGRRPVYYADGGDALVFSLALSPR